MGEPAEEDLASWGHHPTPDTVPDALMARVAQPDVSFIFSCRVSGKHIEGGDEEEQRIAAGTGAAAGAAPMRQAAGRGATAGGRMSSRRGSGAGAGATGAGPAAGSSTPAPTTFLAASGATPAVMKPTVFKGGWGLETGGRRALGMALQGSKISRPQVHIGAWRFVCCVYLPLSCGLRMLQVPLQWRRPKLLLGFRGR